MHHPLNSNRKLYDVKLDIKLERYKELISGWRVAVPPCCTYEASPFCRSFLCSTSRPSMCANYRTKKTNGTPICQALAQSLYDFLGWITTHSWHALYSKSLWPQISAPSFQVCNLTTIKFVAEQTHTKCTIKRGNKKKSIQNVFLLAWDNVEEVKGTRLLWWPSKWMVIQGAGLIRPWCPLLLIHWLRYWFALVSWYPQTGHVVTRMQLQCYPEVRVIAGLAKTIKCTVQKSILYLFILGVRWLWGGCSSWNWPWEFYLRFVFIGVFIWPL